MRTAQTKRKKIKFISKIKSFFIYTFISIVVLGFFLNTFVSNILEYSFALANSGGLVDIKTDEKYSVALVSSNKLQEVKKISIYSYDKKNQKTITVHIDTQVVFGSSESSYSLSDILRVSKNNNLSVNKELEKNLGIRLAFTHIESSDSVGLIEKLLSGTGSIFDLLEARNLEDISIRDLYFIYSFAGSVDSKDKRVVLLNSLEAFDKEIRDLYIDSVIGTNGSSITILNASNINGLAKKYSRVVQNLGGRVIDTSNTEIPSNDSFIVYKERTPGLEFLQSKLGITKSLSIEEVGLKYPEIVKSDLVIVLGVDRGE